MHQECAKFLKAAKKATAKSCRLYLASRFRYDYSNVHCSTKTQWRYRRHHIGIPLPRNGGADGIIHANHRGPTWNIKCETGTIKLVVPELLVEMIVHSLDLMTWRWLVKCR